MTKDLIRRCIERIDPERVAGPDSTGGRFLGDERAHWYVVTILDELSRDLTALAWGATPRRTIAHAAERPADIITTTPAGRSTRQRRG